MPKRKSQRIITKCARQGDVLLLRAPDVTLTRIGDASTDAGSAIELPREKGYVVLAHGEVTGHAHRIRDRGVCLLRAEGVAFDLLRVSEGVLAQLVHEEHGTIAIGPGLYERRIQREYAWSVEAAEMSRAVAD